MRGVMRSGNRSDMTHLNETTAAGEVLLRQLIFTLQKANCEKG